MTIDIPHLPGFSVRKTGAEDTYGRKQTLHYVNGYALQDNLNDKSTAPELPKSVAAETTDSTITGTSSLPAWVAFDRKVLRFYGYFKEDVQNNEIEDHRIRKILVNFYLEDHTMNVSEPKQENSGIPQGCFIKRHLIKKSDGTTFKIADFSIGKTPEVYGRAYNMVDCDGFTREYLSKELNIQVPQALSYPPEPIAVHKESRKKISSGGPPRPRDDDLTRFMEAKLGCASNILLADKLEQYIHNNQRVLRFFCQWDDTTRLYGERRPYVLHYFLEDDTIEILEVYEPNRGVDPFPVFLRRNQLPKSQQNLDVTMEISKNDCYTAQDLVIGGYVNVHNRPFLIYDCDGFTKVYYKEKFGFEDAKLKAIDVSLPEPKAVKREAEAYNGFGSVEDTPAATSLIPKPPKKDFHKLMAKEKMVLRFVTKMMDSEGASALSNSDKDRSFILSYFLADDSISIFEPPTRNSGIIGGKFLERSRINKPNSNQKYSEIDFYKGATIVVHKRVFQLVQADEYSLKYMEDNSEIFTNSNLDKVKASLSEDGKASLTGDVTKAQVSAAFPELNDARLETLFRSLDIEKTGSIKADQL